MTSFLSFDLEYSTLPGGPTLRVEATTMTILVSHIILRLPTRSCSPIRSWEFKGDMTFCFRDSVSGGIDRKKEHPFIIAQAT